MKNRKKFLSLCLIGAMSAAALAGCGSSSSQTAASADTASGTTQDTAESSASSQDAVSLTFGIWDENQRDAMQQMVDAYEKENPNVSIEIQLTPYKGSEYWTKLEASATGGTAPDVFWINVLHLDSYEQGGILADLTDKIAASDIGESFPESLLQNYQRDGKYYAVPKDFDTNALWYNKDLFDQAGVAYPTDDMSYDDLVAMCAELKDKLPDGVYPFACPVDFQTWYYQTIYANGGYILNDDKTETGYDLPETQEGIQCWIDLINDGYSPSASTLSETGADAMFEGQQIAMNFAGSYMLPEYAANEDIKDKIDCAEIPTFNGVEDNVINGLGYAVYAGSKNLDAAEDFAIWLGSQEAQDIQGKTGVVISARTDCQKDFAEANSQYNVAAYTNHADIAYPLPVCLNAAELYDTEATWLTKAYTGEMSLKDACASLKQEADALLTE
jgi:multiple sugar transport system substrate-binding protein